MKAIHGIALAFNYAGDCRDYEPQFPTPYACKSFAAGLYGDCHNAPGLGHWPSSKTHREVITVYVSE